MAGRVARWLGVLIPLVLVTAAPAAHAGRAPKIPPWASGTGATVGRAAVEATAARSVPGLAAALPPGMGFVVRARLLWAGEGASALAFRDPEHLVLATPSGLVERTLATGEERTLLAEKLAVDGLIGPRSGLLGAVTRDGRAFLVTDATLTEVPGGGVMPEPSAISPDGHWLALADATMPEVWLWSIGDPAAPEPRFALRLPVASSPLSMAFDPDGTLLTASERAEEPGGIVERWDPTLGARTGTVRLPAPNVGVSTDARFAAFWDAREAGLAALPAGTELVRAATRQPTLGAVAPVGPALVFAQPGNGDGEGTTTDIEALVPGPVPARALTTTHDTLAGLVWSPDGRRLAVLGYAGWRVHPADLAPRADTPTAAPIAAPPATAAPTTRPSAPPTTPEGLLATWVDTQNRGDAEAYGALYAPEFRGVLRSGQLVEELERDAWVDRHTHVLGEPDQVVVDGVMVKKVGKEPPTVSFREWRRAGASATQGRVTMKLRAEGERLVIVRQETEDAVPWPGDVTVTSEGCVARAASCAPGQPASRCDTRLPEEGALVPADGELRCWAFVKNPGTTPLRVTLEAYADRGGEGAGSVVRLARTRAPVAIPPGGRARLWVTARDLETHFGSDPRRGRNGAELLMILVADPPGPAYRKRVFQSVRVGAPAAP